MLPTKNIKSTVFNEKYYLVCNDIENNNGKNCILELNLLKNKVNFYEMNEIVDLYTIKCNDIYKLIVINKNNNLEILELGNQVNNNPKYVKFNKVLFDYASSKYLTEINIFSIGKYTLKITSDFEKKTIEVENNLSLRNLGISGNYFEFEILSEFEFCIQGIIVNIDFFTEKI